MSIREVRSPAPWRPDEGEVEPTREHARQKSDRLVFKQLDLDVRMLLAEVIEQHGDQPSRGAVDRADAQLRRPAARLLPEAVLDRVGLCEKLTRITEKLLALLGQDDIAGRAHEQLGAQSSSSSRMKRPKAEGRMSSFCAA